MIRKRLIWQLFPPLWMITIIALIAVTVFISQTFERFHLDQVVSELNNKAIIVKNYIAGQNLAFDEFIDGSFCKELFDGIDTRLTIIDSTGLVWCDSEEDAETMENHALRPEIIRALAGDVGVEVRYSKTLKADLVYVAIPLIENGRIVGAIRTSRSVAVIHEALMNVYWRVILGGLAVIILILLASLYTSRRLTEPLNEMRLVSNEYAQGNLNHRMPEHGTREIGDLAEAMNQMAADLNERINTIIRQKNEQEAVFSSMIEGVMAIDLNERVININKAAENILGISAELAYGRYIYEVIRNTQIQEFAKKSLTEKKAIEGEIVLSRGKDIYIQAHGAALRDADGKLIGTVIVLNDITKIRELENIRRDFVANVSHELKTPITSIKGFVETLQDGAINNPADAERFLSIIIKQAERLNSIIEDLLSLSRIEQNEAKTGIEFAEQKIRNVLKTAVQMCEQQSKSNNVNIVLECDEELKAKINEDLLHQAIVNLLNNAIKYSPKGDRVYVTAEQEDDSIVINVIDNGIGIPKEHQPRIFERFYRVDKERSRQLGGTGLGLAIVKHIVLAHHGKVTVDSATGKGSTFTITLPVVKAQS